MMINLISLWQAAKESVPSNDGEFITSLIDVNCFHKLYYGINNNAEVLFAIETENEPNKVFYKSLSFEIFPYKRNNLGWFVVFVLKDTTLISVFEKLCLDLVYSIISIKSDQILFDFLQTRLRSWKALLSSKVEDILTDIEIQGLLAELFVLKELLNQKDFYAVEIINNWVGPSKADQDFQFDDYSIEVKSILPDSDSITISSLSQLSTNVKLFLYLVEFIKSPTETIETYNLNNLTDSILDHLSFDSVALNIFELKLLESGFIKMNIYSNFNFFVNRVDKLLVNAKFPKLTPESIPLGIVAAEYKLSVDFLRGLNKYEQ
jgi:hypothetical protein